MKTLHDHLLAGGPWPKELEPVLLGGGTLPAELNALCVLYQSDERFRSRFVVVCLCGKRSGPRNFYLLKTGRPSSPDRIPGRVRRSRMRREVRQYAEQAAKQRLREPEVSPAWACGWCVGAMRKGWWRG